MSLVTLGHITAIQVVIDGEPTLVEGVQDDQGVVQPILFRYTSPTGAHQMCRLAARSGGMIVAEEARGSIVAPSAYEGTTPVSSDARQAAEAASKRPTPPVRPGRAKPPVPAAAG